MPRERERQPERSLLCPSNSNTATSASLVLTAKEMDLRLAGVTCPQGARHTTGGNWLSLGHMPASVTGALAERL